MTVVLKLGGSLLTSPNLADRLHELIRYRSGEHCLFVVGGGAAADVVRDWSRIHHLSEEDSHWLAIESMELNRQFVGRLLHWKSVSSIREAESHWSADPSPLLLEMPTFAREQERRGQTIPHHWNVTSDSLAVWVARSWSAQELILIKSVPCPAEQSLGAASESGLVDEYFPQIAQSLPRISWCNLRAPNVSLDAWITRSKATK